MSRFPGRLAVLAYFALTTSTFAADWPAWRYDARRTGASPTGLTAELKLHWTLSLPTLSPAWPDQPLMPFDGAYEPIVVGRTMFVGSSRTDGVSAYDTRTGTLKWRFTADGPVRFAPYWSAGKLYVACDDGYLYCLKADNGEVAWKFRGGPSDRLILGNNRLVSTWPARGAPVVADGVVYFAASIWPFMGVFIHALDAETGRVIWTTDGDGSMYVKQPHSADSFAGVAPQGPMAIAEDLLLIPGGRSVPAAYDRKTGKFRHFLLNENSKKGGGHTVVVGGDVFFNGFGVFRTTTGKYLGDCSPLCVATPDEIHMYQSGEVRSFDLSDALTHANDPKAKFKPDVLGAMRAPGTTAMIRAGDRLYVGGLAHVGALKLPLPERPPARPTYAWEADIDGVPASIVAADDRLFVATREDRIYCFGPGDPPAILANKSPDVLPANNAARHVVEASGANEGYAVAYTADVDVLADLIRRTKLHVIAVDPDAARVKSARDALIAADLYGDRCSVHVGEPGVFSLPPYVANLIYAGDLKPESLPRVYESLRPYGGTLYLNVGKERFAEYSRAAKLLPKAVVKEMEHGLLIVRDGALPGSADWTHEHADAANTRVSKDSVVKAPLGVLWFGGTSNEGILPRHGHGPQPQVVGGRIIVEGADLLRAVDVYTGRLLWESPLPGLGEYYNNLAHQPGANSRGTNYISLPDGIYAIYRDGCVVLDPATGKRVNEFKLPNLGHATTPTWGHLNVVDDFLIAAADPIVTASADKQAKSPSKLFKIGDDNYSASRHVAVLNRRTGKFLWSADARYGFRHNTLCSGNGRLFAIDRLSGIGEAKAKDDGQLPPPPRAVAWDLATGKELWSDAVDTFGTWLSYSEKYDVLIEAGRMARDTLFDEPKGMRAYRGTDGKELWFDKSAVGPAMLHGEMILRGQGACDLLTGKPKLRRDPISGEMEEWVWSRNYGCNTPLASEHLLTFRSGAAGYFDLCNDAGTGNFGGFRSSCTNNLIVANGVLAAPDYTRTCTCSYQNQTSIALVPMADAEEWTFYGKSDTKKTVKHVGINFGAPGDRRADDGTLWLEYPSTGGSSPAIPIQVTGPKLTYFRRHQSAVTGDLPWVASSGMSGVESLVVKLLPTASRERLYTIRLQFAEPDDVRPGGRVFDVTIQGRKVLDDFDIVKEAGRPRKALVKTFHGIRVDDELRLSFRARGARGAVLCGIEVVAE